MTDKSEQRVFGTADRVMGLVTLLGVLVAAFALWQGNEGLGIGAVLTVFVALTYFGMAL